MGSFGDQVFAHVKNIFGGKKELKPIITAKDGEGDVPPLQVALKVLEERNLPYGLLPVERISEFEFNPNTGRFRIVQPVECDCTFEGHKLKFLRNISGKVDVNTLRDVKGIMTKVAFIWAPITAVDVDPKPGPLIHFWSGPFKASMGVQALWEYKFWGPAFHDEPEKVEEVSPDQAAGTLCRVERELERHGGVAGAAGALVPGLPATALVQVSVGPTLVAAAES